MRKDDYQIVELNWLDSRLPTSEWRRLDEIDDIDACYCKTVGYLIRENDEEYVLASSIADHDGETWGQSNGILCIPKISVLNKRVLPGPIQWRLV